MDRLQKEALVAEMKGVFDEAAVVYHDPDHSNEEDRFLQLGNRIMKGSELLHY